MTPETLPARVRLAEALDRVGLMRAVLAARARSLLPWRWLTVLAYHRVAPAGSGFDADVIDATPHQFEQQVATLKRYFTLVDSRAVDDWRAGQPLPPNPAMITFDDGYRDNHDVVLPILRRHGVSATFFVSTAYVSDRRLFWWESIAYLLQQTRRTSLQLSYPHPMDFPLSDAGRRGDAIRRLLRMVKDLPGLDLDRFVQELAATCDVSFTSADERRLSADLIMSWDHVRALRAAGMDVQSHGHRHRILGTQSAEDTEQDLATARAQLEDKLDSPVHALAYPAGRGLGMAPSFRNAVVRAGYTLGFTCGTGIDRLGPRMDWLNIRRVSMESGMSTAYLRGCLAIPALAY